MEGLSDKIQPLIDGAAPIPKAAAPTRRSSIRSAIARRACAASPRQFPDQAGGGRAAARAAADRTFSTLSPIRGSAPGCGGTGSAGQRRDRRRHRRGPAAPGHPRLGRGPGGLPSACVGRCSASARTISSAPSAAIARTIRWHGSISATAPAWSATTGWGTPPTRAWRNWRACSPTTHDPASIETNHEIFASTGEVVCSSGVRALLPKLADSA